MTINPDESGIYSGPEMLRRLAASSPSWRSHIGAADDAESLARVRVFDLDATDYSPLILIEYADGYSRRRNGTAGVVRSGTYVMSISITIEANAKGVPLDSSIVTRDDERNFFMNLAGSIVKEMEELSWARQAIMGGPCFNIEETKTEMPFRVPFTELFNNVSPMNANYRNSPVWFVGVQVESR